MKTERMKEKAKMMFKILNNNGPPSFTDLFTYNKYETNAYNLRDVPVCLSTPFQRTITYKPKAKKVVHCQKSKV